MCALHGWGAVTKDRGVHIPSMITTTSCVPELMAWQDTALLRSDSISLLLRVSEAFSSSTCIEIYSSCISTVYNHGYA
jgi:hypothetical protein